MSGDLGLACLPRVGSCRKTMAPIGTQAAKHAADADGRIGIVVAGDPDPVAAALQRRKRVAILVGQALRPVAVMEAVAEREHRCADGNA